MATRSQNFGQLPRLRGAAQNENASHGDE
jgi:hypothetical protein